MATNTFLRLKSSFYIEYLKLKTCQTLGVDTCLRHDAVPCPDSGVVPLPYRRHESTPYVVLSDNKNDGRGSATVYAPSHIYLYNISCVEFPRPKPKSLRRTINVKFDKYPTPNAQFRNRGLVLKHEYKDYIKFLVIFKHIHYASYSFIYN